MARRTPRTPHHTLVEPQRTEYLALEQAVAELPDPSGMYWHWSPRRNSPQCWNASAVRAARRFCRSCALHRSGNRAPMRCGRRWELCGAAKGPSGNTSSARSPSPRSTACGTDCSPGWNRVLIKAFPGWRSWRRTGPYCCLPVWCSGGSHISRSRCCTWCCATILCRRGLPRVPTPLCGPARHSKKLIEAVQSTARRPNQFLGRRAPRGKGWSRGYG